MKNKKGVEMVPAIIITFIIVLVVLVVMVFIFRTYIGKETDVLQEQLDSFGDEDKDGIRNFLDKCPCDCGVNENDGCPEATTPPKTKPDSCKNNLNVCK